MTDRQDHRPRITLERRRSRLPLLAKIRQRLVLILALLLICFGAILMLLVAVLTLFQARRFYAEVMGKNLARIALWLHGVKLVVHRDGPWPKEQVVYISNHTSSLDVLVIIALGLPNCRYFMGGFLRAIPPIWVIGGLMGMFWTPRQAFPDRRRRLFQRASARLNQTGESVFLTPEGQICWVFNKGAFHLAISLKAPIIPFFITIPAEIDPGPWTGGHGMEVRRGEVHVHFRPPIQTGDWKVEDLNKIRIQIRNMYFDWAMALGDKSVHAPEAVQLRKSTDEHRCRECS